MKDPYDSVPRQVDRNTPQPAQVEVAAMEAANAAAVAAADPRRPGPYPEVNTLLESGPGVYGYKSETKRYGLAETIAAIQEVAGIWNRRHPGRRFGVGDISLLGGGEIGGHASHERGVDIDVRPLRRDWQEGPIEYQSEDYSFERTQELIDLFWTNSYLGVDVIFFNDRNIQGTDPWINHDNHFHVRVYRPGEAAAPPVLRRGNDLEAANNELQRCLNFWQLATGHPGRPLTVDGIFGENTYERLRDFQGAQGITVNGIAEASTWEQLQNWRA